MNHRILVFFPCCQTHIHVCVHTHTLTQTQTHTLTHWPWQNLRMGNWLGLSPSGGLPLNWQPPGISAGTQLWLVVIHGESWKPLVGKQRNWPADHSAARTPLLWPRRPHPLTLHSWRGDWRPRMGNDTSVFTQQIISQWKTHTWAFSPPPLRSSQHKNTSDLYPFLVLSIP